MKSKQMTAMVNRIVKKHGAIIDLRKNPEVLIDILRELASDLTSGNPCGGTPPSPTGPTKRSKPGRPITNDDLMRAVLRAARDISEIRKSLADRKTRR